MTTTPMPGHILPTVAGFITEWTVAGDETARTITLPLYNSGTFDCIVDWGDGTTDSIVTAFDDADRIHVYASDGTYEVEITGDCPSWSFANAGDKLKITDIINWGEAVDFSGFGYLTSAFYGCTNLASLGLGKIQALDELDEVKRIFTSCSSITSIPIGLFDNCVNLTAEAFFSAFDGCTSLETIPTDLFRYNTEVSTQAFYSTFVLCTSLVSIPTDLFRYNTGVGYGAFFRAFYGCASLETVPELLFKYNTAVSNNTFYRTFYGCNKLQLNAKIFYDTGEASTRFLNKVIDFENCFYRTSFTGTQGTAPDLWNCDFGTETPVTTNCFAGAGNSLTSLDNYGDIPTAWGGA